MILITGATGNNGQELIRQLTAMGQRVRALVRKPAEAAKVRLTSATSAPSQLRYSRVPVTKGRLMSSPDRKP